MPRRKTKQPNPLSIEFYGDILVEIHDVSTWPIYRGLHTVAKWKHTLIILVRINAKCETVPKKPKKKQSKTKENVKLYQKYYKNNAESNLKFIRI